MAIALSRVDAAGLEPQGCRVVKLWRHRVYTHYTPSPVQLSVVCRVEEVMVHVSSDVLEWSWQLPRIVCPSPFMKDVLQFIAKRIFQLLYIYLLATRAPWSSKFPLTFGVEQKNIGGQTHLKLTTLFLSGKTHLNITMTTPNRCFDTLDTLILFDGILRWKWDYGECDE